MNASINVFPAACALTASVLPIAYRDKTMAFSCGSRNLFHSNTGKKKIAYNLLYKIERQKFPMMPLTSLE